MQPLKESFSVKLLYIAALLLSASVSFYLTDPLAYWIKTNFDVIASFPVQLVMSLPVALLVFSIEEKFIKKLSGLDVFFTIHPISMGVSIGYLMHFAFNANT